MPRKVSIATKVTADASASGKTTVFTVPGAYVFRTASVYISFPAGTYGELEISLYRGEQKIAPYSGVYTGDACVIEDEFIEDIASAERVIVAYKNNNSTQAREANIIIRGELA